MKHSERNIHDDVLEINELIDNKLKKYDQLVWFARKHPSDHPSWNDVPEDIRTGALNSAARVEEMYPDEVDELQGENSDWSHGFNSGMLAALRLVVRACSDPKEAEECFPELYT